MLKIIDVSHHQGNIDFARVKASGVAGAILKATEGVNYTDPNFAAYAQAATAAGLPIGAYHFLRSTPVDQQASDFLAAIKPYKLALPVACDVEHAELLAMGKDKLTDFVLAFCAPLKTAGYKVMVYASKSWLDNNLDVARLRAAGLDIWLAWYSNATPDDTDRSGISDMWQYCSDGHVDGIVGNVDCNVCYRDYLGVAPAPVPAPAAKPGPIANALYRVRAGGRWLREVTNLDDYAGLPGVPITDIAVRVTSGSVEYRVHVKGSGWLPIVTGCDINNAANGYAGNGRPIDAVEIYYFTPDGVRPVRKAKYHVSPVGGAYWPWQHDDEIKDGQDGYAGSFGKAIDRLQITVE